MEKGGGEEADEDPGGRAFYSLFKTRQTFGPIRIPLVRVCFLRRHIRQARRGELEQNRNCKGGGNEEGRRSDAQHSERKQ